MYPQEVRRLLLIPSARKGILGETERGFQWAGQNGSQQGSAACAAVELRSSTFFVGARVVPASPLLNAFKVANLQRSGGLCFVFVHFLFSHNTEVGFQGIRFMLGCLQAVWTV